MVYLQGKILNDAVNLCSNVVLCIAWGCSGSAWQNSSRQSELPWKLGQLFLWLMANSKLFPVFRNKQILTCFLAVSKSVSIHFQYMRSFQVEKCHCMTIDYGILFVLLQQHESSRSWVIEKDIWIQTSLRCSSIAPNSQMITRII